MCRISSTIYWRALQRCFIPYPVDLAKKVIFLAGKNTFYIAKRKYSILFSTSFSPNL
jgi:hypothetical protein